MNGDQEIRVRALADQLREIDLRLDSAERWRCSQNQRRGHLVSSGVLVVSLAKLGVGMVWSIPVPLVINMSLEPCVRWIMKRRAEKARTRLFQVLAAIDQRLSPVEEGWKGKDPPSTPIWRPGNEEGILRPITWDSGVRSFRRASF